MRHIPKHYLTLVILRALYKEEEKTTLEDVVELVPRVGVLGVVGDAREAGDERVLRPDVQCVENLPVDVAHLPRRVEKALDRKKNVTYLVLHKMNVSYQPDCINNVIT